MINAARTLSLINGSIWHLYIHRWVAANVWHLDLRGIRPIEMYQRLWHKMLATVASLTESTLVISGWVAARDPCCHLHLLHSGNI
jgi:hypothetical protein